MVGIHFLGYKLVTAFFILIGVFFNSVMDAVENENFFESIFKKMDQRFWYKRESWKHAKVILNGYKVDAWHLAKTISGICYLLGAVFYNPIFIWWIDFFLFLAEWVVFFWLFYHKIFKVK